MSKATVDYSRLKNSDTKNLMELERQVLGDISREVAERREAKRNKGKKKKRGRR